MPSTSDPLTTAHGGERWVVRHRLPEGQATDLIGWVGQLQPDWVELMTQHGATERIARRSVVAARRLPAAAGGPSPRRTSAAELEGHALPGWLAYSEPLGEWTLRAGGGFTGRANSAHAVGDPGVPVSVAAGRVVTFAEQHGIAPMAQVILPSPEERGLRALGWTDTYVSTEVLAVGLAELLGDGPAPAGVVISEELRPAWWDSYQRSRPNDVDPAVLRLILDGHPPRAFASVGDDTGGGLVAIARGHLDGPWLGLASIWTTPEHRRRGHATALMFGLGHWAARRGARYAYLQVATANTAALAAYARAGFRPHHRYGYLRPPATSS